MTLKGQGLDPKLVTVHYLEMAGDTQSVTINAPIGLAIGT